MIQAPLLASAVMVLVAACAQTNAPLVSDSLLVVPPVSGLESTNAQALAAAMANDLTSRGIPARAAGLNEGLPADAFVMGRVDAVEERHSLLWMMVRWSVMTPDGGTVGTIEREVVVDKQRWTESEPLTMGFAISETGPSVLETLASIGIAPPAPMVTDMRTPAASEEANMAAESKMATEEMTSGTPTDVSRLMETPADSLLKEPTKVMAGEPTSADSILEKLQPADDALMASEGATATEAMEPTLAQGPGSAEEVLGQMGGPAIEGVEPVSPNQTQAAQTEPLRDSILPGPPTPDPNAWARTPIFLVRPVYGAPGTGNRDLTEALRRTLAERGARITEVPTQASHVLQGSVRISQPFGGRQKARIVWLVTTVGGNEVGTATQENDVATGSLNGSWGVIADHIAVAAVNGVQ